jgi:O-antigen/teichoic acid export membrane protein
MDPRQEQQFNLILVILLIATLIMLLFGALIHEDEAARLFLAVGSGFFSIMAWAIFLTDALGDEHPFVVWIFATLSIVGTTAFVYFATRSGTLTGYTCMVVPLIVIAILVRWLKRAQS